MTEKETLILVGALAVGYVLLRKPSKGGPAQQLAATQLSAQQLAAQQQAQAAARGASAASQAGAIIGGIGQSFGSILAGIGALTGGGSGTNKENGGNYSYESTAVVDEYDSLPDTMYADSDTAGASGAWSGAAAGAYGGD